MKGLQDPMLQSGLQDGRPSAQGLLLWEAWGCGGLELGTVGRRATHLSRPQGVLHPWGHAFGPLQAQAGLCCVLGCGGFCVWGPSLLGASLYLPQPHLWGEDSFCGP